jgi:peroxiredoxin
MTVQVGDAIPDVKVKIIDREGTRDVFTKELFAEGKNVLFAVPGAFTPTCSDYHLPGFVVRADEIHDKGVKGIYCIAANDAFVMSAWGQSRDVDPDYISLLADGNADFAKAMGLEMDGSAFGLGTRSQRYAAIIEDGIIQHLNVEAAGKFEVSSADAVLALL